MNLREVCEEHNLFCLNANTKDINIVWIEAFHPSQQFFSHVGMFSWVEPVLSNGDEVSCSRTQHLASGEIRTRDLAIKSAALY